MTRILHHLRRNAVAYVALFVALSGTSYAAFTLPPGSVGQQQIKNHAITPVKFNNHFINGSVRAWAIVGSGGHVIAGGGKPKASGDAPYPGIYVVKWAAKFGKNCTANVTVDSNYSPATERVPVPGNPSVPVTSGFAVGYTAGGRQSVTSIDTFDQSGRLTPLGFDVAVIC